MTDFKTLQNTWAVRKSEQTITRHEKIESRAKQQQILRTLWRKQLQ